MEEQLEDFGIRSPLLDMFETKKEWIFELELPGVDPKTLEVVRLEHSIVVRGERAQPYSSEDMYVFQERQFVKYFRSIPLPEGIDAADAVATFVDGVLRLVSPKNKKTTGAKIKVG